MVAETPLHLQDPAPSGLGGMREAGAFKRMMAISAAAHAGIVILAIISGWLGARRPLKSEQAIQTRLVRLGQDKPEWLPRMETPPAPPKQEAVPISPTKAAPVETPKKTPSKEENKQSFDQAMKKLTDWEKKTKDDYKGKGDPRGSKQGTVSDFTMQTLGMQYATDIDQRIRPNWVIPSVVADSGQKLEAVVVLFIAANGKVMNVELEKKSGNALFDNALLKAIQVSSPLPPPPGELRDRVLHDGFEITFSNKR